MTTEPSLLTRRRLSPERLRAARLAAGFDKISVVCRRIGIKRLAYTRWEAAPGLPYFDYLAFHNALELFGVTYQDVTEEMPAEETELMDDLPAPSRRLSPTPAQAPA